MSQILIESKIKFFRFMPAEKKMFFSHFSIAIFDFPAHQLCKELFESKESNLINTY